MTKSHENEMGASETVPGEKVAGATALAELSYEVAFAQLEEILLQLESDDLPLETSLTLYEQGMALVGRCTGLLDSATLRVQQWQENGTTTNFDGWQEG